MSYKWLMFSVIFLREGILIQSNIKGQYLTLMIVINVLKIIFLLSIKKKKQIKSLHSNEYCVQTSFPFREFQS